MKLSQSFFIELESQAHYLKYLFYFIPDCGTGYFGAQCANLCSEHCAGIDNSCNNVNGTCNMGCDPGYKGFLCTQGDFKHTLIRPVVSGFLKFRLFAIWLKKTFCYRFFNASVPRKKINKKKILIFYVFLNVETENSFLSHFFLLLVLHRLKGAYNQ